MPIAVICKSFRLLDAHDHGLFRISFCLISSYLYCCRRTNVCWLFSKKKTRTRRFIMASPKRLTPPSFLLLCLLFPFSQWNQVMQVGCPAPAEQVVKTVNRPPTRSQACHCDWCQKRKWCRRAERWPKESPLAGRDTVTNRKRTRSTHFPSTGIEAAPALTRVFFLLLGLPNSRLLSAEKREIYSAFSFLFSHLLLPVCLNCQGSRRRVS